MYEDEIDLRPYLFALIRSWWLMGLLAILAAVIVFFVINSRSQYYEASATLLLTQSRSRLSLASQFPTTNDAANPSNRIQTLLSLLESENFSQQILQVLEEEYPESISEMRAAQNQITVSAEGDLLEVTAKAADPEIASEVANTWARQAILVINQAYTEELPLPQIQSQLTSAEEIYLSDQTSLEQFLQENQISLIEKQLAEAKSLLDTIASERTSRIEFYTQRAAAMEELEVQAEAIKRQLENVSISNAGSIGDALAVIKARAEMFGIEKGNRPNPIQTLPIQVDSKDQESSDPPILIGTSTQIISAPDKGLALDVQLPAIEELIANREAFVNDIDGLIQQARNEQALAQENIKSLSNEVTGNQPSEELQAASAQVQELEAQLEQAKARKLELTSKRDLSWEAFQALAQKETELANGIEASSYANLAIPALPPSEPAGSQAVLKAGVAAVLGLIIGALWILGSTWWRILVAGSSSKMSIPAADGTD